MPKISAFVLIPPFTFLGLAVLFLFGMQREGPNEMRSTLIGQSAP